MRLFECLDESKFMYSCIQSLLCIRYFSVLIKTSDHKNLNFHLTVNESGSSFFWTHLLYLLRSVLTGQQNVSSLVSDERGVVIYSLQVDLCHIAIMENFLTFCHPSVALCWQSSFVQTAKAVPHGIWEKVRKRVLFVPLLWLTRAF